MSTNVSTDTMRIAVVNAPHIIDDVRSAGVEVIADSDFRSAIRLVNKALSSGDRLDAVIVGDADVGGLRGWIRHVAHRVNVVIVKSYGNSFSDIDGVNQVKLPRALDDVLFESGAGISTGTSVTLGVDPLAPKEAQFRAERPSFSRPEPEPAALIDDADGADDASHHDQEEPQMSMPQTNPDQTGRPDAEPAPAPPQPQSPPQQVNQEQMGYPPQQGTGPQPSPQQNYAQPAQPQMPTQQMPQVPQQWPGQQTQSPQPQMFQQNEAPQDQNYVQPAPQQNYAQPAQPQMPPQQGNPQWQNQWQPQQTWNQPPQQANPWQQQQQQQQGWQQPQQQMPTQFNQAPQDHYDLMAQRNPVAADADDLFENSGSSTKLAPVVVISAFKGGVGKTTTAIGVAQQSAKKGLSTILIDGNVGQDGSVSVRLRIHRADHLPTAYDAAVKGDPDTALVTPSMINSVRSVNKLDDIRFVLVQAPTSETADRNLLTNDFYLKLIHRARQRADIVVLDTQIIESENYNPDSLFWKTVVPLVRNNEAWLILVSDDDREAVKNTGKICTTLTNKFGIERKRMFTLLNLFDPRIVDSSHASEKMKNYSIPVGVVDFNPNIKKKFAQGFTAGSIDTFAPVFNNVLRIVTGDTRRFPREEPKVEPRRSDQDIFGDGEGNHESAEPVTKKKPGFFARLFGRR